MTISVAGLGHQGPLWQLLANFAGIRTAASGAAPAAVGNGNAPLDTTSLAHSSATLATILAQLDTADQASAGAATASSSPAAPSASSDPSDGLITQLEGDLKALFSDLHHSNLSLRTSSPQAPDDLLGDLKGNWQSLAPAASADGTMAVDPMTDDAGDGLLAQLESDLKNLFADLQSIAGKPSATPAPGGTYATPTAPNAPTGASPALLRVLGTYAAEASAADGTSA